MEDDILDLVSTCRSTTEATRSSRKARRSSRSKDSRSSSPTEGKHSSSSTSDKKKKRKSKKPIEGDASRTKSSSSKKKKKSSSSDAEKSKKSPKKNSSSSASKSPVSPPKVFKTIPVVAPPAVDIEDDFDDVSMITTPRAIRTKDEKKKKKKSKKYKTSGLPPLPPPPPNGTDFDQEFDILDSIKAGFNSEELEAVPDENSQDEEYDSDRDEEVGIRTASNSGKDLIDASSNISNAAPLRKAHSTDRSASGRVPEPRQPRSFAERDALEASPASQNSQKGMHRIDESGDAEESDYDEEEAEEQAPPPEQRQQRGRGSQKAPYHGEDVGEYPRYEPRDLEDPEKECDDEKDDRLRKRRILMLVIAIICCVVVVIIVVVVLVAGGGKDDNKETAVQTTESPAADVVNPDDGFAYESIVVASGQVTSAMASYDNDCDFNNGNGFPHVFDQCRCENTIVYVPEDVAAVRDELIVRMFPFFYDGQTYTEPIASCNPTNMALVWLASGNNRAGGVLQQRYALALTFFTLDGSLWDFEDGWLSSDNECYWMGLQVSVKTHKIELRCLFLNCRPHQSFSESSALMVML